MKIRFVSVENNIAEWADKKALMRRWEGLKEFLRWKQRTVK
ncbi:hypothetical protein [Ligilactobacillus equi]